MTLQRSYSAGETDYTGADLSDILIHLDDWRKNTQETIRLLVEYKAEVEQCQGRLDDPNDIICFINYFLDVLARFVKDFARLIDELPKSVEERHVAIVKQLFDLGESAERVCVNFKVRHIARGLKDESLRWLVDEIYSKARDQAIDYIDLSNLRSRLKTFVGTSFKPRLGSIEQIDVLELKPNMFGVGINLNYLIKRLGLWWKVKRSH